MLTMLLLALGCGQATDVGDDAAVDGGLCRPDSGTWMWRGEVLGAFPVVQVETADGTVQAPSGWRVVGDELLVFCGSADGIVASVLWL